MWNGLLITGSQAGGVTPAAPTQAVFNFTGGVLKVATVDTSMSSITQTAASGPSLLDVTGNNTTLGVNYTLTGNGTNAATVNVAAGHKLTMANGGVALTMGDYAQFGLGTGTIAGLVAVTGSTNMTFPGVIADASGYHGALTMSGTGGMLTLTGTNTYRAPRPFNAGTLAVNGAALRQRPGE